MSSIATILATEKKKLPKPESPFNATIFHRNQAYKKPLTETPKKKSY
jgi:hypothetical protein